MFRVFLKMSTVFLEVLESSQEINVGQKPDLLRIRFT